MSQGNCLENLTLEHLALHRMTARLVRMECLPSEIYPATSINTSLQLRSAANVPLKRAPEALDSMRR